MKYLDMIDTKVSNIIAGCMRYNSLTEKELDTQVKTALDLGINFFDHADIYGKGESQKVFGNFLKNNKSLREKMIIQTKCGIKDGYYDFSKEHIISSVKKSLKDLNTDYVDILLLHRPDLLMDPKEIDMAFRYLKKTGMVKHFGVSNFNTMYLKYLQKHLSEKIVANQLQLSPVVAFALDHIVLTNTSYENSATYDGEVFTYCAMEDIRIQAWSPYQYGFIDGVYIDNPDFKELNDALQELADEYNVTKNAIVAAWISTLPYDVQTVVGSTKPERLKEIAKGSEIKLTREQWYKIYDHAGNKVI